MSKEALAVLSMVLLAAVAGAQEPVREDEMADEQAVGEQAPEARRPLRVLNNPYEISSFYRSAEGGYFWGPGYGYPMGGPGYPANGSERYPIASYYRSPYPSGYGYAPFWTGGYGHGGRGHGHGQLGFGYRRRIGENGDLFLFAPAFLAPVGPLSGIFFSQPPK
jgi:hypothetical protein